MANYISSNANRFYVAPEASYGQAASVSAANRFPAVRLAAQQVLEHGVRHDKTGSRTFLGISPNSRRQTAFEVRTCLTSLAGKSSAGYGPLFYAALGAQSSMTAAMQIASSATPMTLQTASAHGLSFGAGVSTGNEIRFVAGTPDPSTILLNAPFSTPISAGATLSPVISYSLANQLPSLTLFDYWDPQHAVDRIVTGAGVDSLEFSVNGDYHEFVFRGPAADLLDTTSFVQGSAGLTSYPQEPALAQFDYTIVPGHLGEVWLGSPSNQYLTLTTAKIQLKNHLDVRNHEFGSSYPRAIAPGPRQVISQFTVFAQDDAQTQSLYQAAKARTSISAMIQLGFRQGQLMGVFLPNMTPEVPNFDDAETRLQWEFKNNYAQGTSNDELFVAFA